MNALGLLFVYWFVTGVVGGFVVSLFMNRHKARQIEAIEPVLTMGEKHG